MSIGLSSRTSNLSTPKEAEVQSAFEVANLFRHKTSDRLEHGMLSTPRSDLRGD